MPKPNIVELNKDTPSVQYLCKKCKRLAKVIEMVGPIQYTTHNEDAYSFLVHEIIEQMLSVTTGLRYWYNIWAFSFAFFRDCDAKFEGLSAGIGVWRRKIAGFRFSESNAQFASERIEGKIGR